MIISIGWELTAGRALTPRCVIFLTAPRLTRRVTSRYVGRETLFILLMRTNRKVPQEFNVNCNETLCDSVDAKDDALNRHCATSSAGFTLGYESVLTHRQTDLRFFHLAEELAQYLSPASCPRDFFSSALCSLATRGPIKGQ